MFGHTIRKNGPASLDALRLDEGGIVTAVMPLPGARCLWLIEAEDAAALTSQQRRWVEQMESFGHEICIGTLGALSTRAVAILQEMGLL